MGETEQEQIKVLIVSDSHGRNDNLRKAVANMRGTHCRMLHAGDFQCSPQEIYDLAGVPVDMVRGNCDSSLSGVPLSRIVEIGGYRILLTRGHQYAGIDSIGNMSEMARANDVQIVVCGHTHIPHMEKRGDVWVVNPGSISQPRQPGHQPSYLVMNIEHGTVDFVPVYLTS